MFALAFDLDVELAQQRHPKSTRQAYLDLERLLKRHGFRRIQWSVYAADTDDLGKLFLAILALKSLPWLGMCLKDLRAFRTDKGSDFTAIVKGQD